MQRSHGCPSLGNLRLKNWAIGRRPKLSILTVLAGVDPSRLVEQQRRRVRRGKTCLIKNYLMDPEGN